MNIINSSAVGAFRCPACGDWHMEGDFIWAPWVNDDGSVVCYYHVATQCANEILALDQEGHDAAMKGIQDKLCDWYPEITEKVQGYKQMLFTGIAALIKSSR